MWYSPNASVEPAYPRGTCNLLSHSTGQGCVFEPRSFNPRLIDDVVAVGFVRYAFVPSPPVNCQTGQWNGMMRSNAAEKGNRYSSMCGNSDLVRRNGRTGHKGDGALDKKSRRVRQLETRTKPFGPFSLLWAKGKGGRGSMVSKPTASQCLCRVTAAHRY